MGVGPKSVSRNPNICASCSSLLDGMDLPGVERLPELSHGEESESAEPALLRQAGRRGGGNGQGFGV